MIRSAPFKYSLLLLLSFATITHTDSSNQTPDATSTPAPRDFDIFLLSALAVQCEKYNADAANAHVDAPEWNTCFTSNIQGAGILSRLGRVLWLSEAPRTVAITSTTEFANQNTEPKNIVKTVIAHQARQPDTEALTQCTKEVDTDGSSTVTCTVVYELQQFKALLDSFETRSKRKLHHTN